MKSIIFWDMTPCSPLSCIRSSSETSGATLRTTRRRIPEDDTLHNHRCENLKSYTAGSSFGLRTLYFASAHFLI
jgi:hypothetical protein